eukprot:257782-Prymnesium_polylepis.1
MQWEVQQRRSLERDFADIEAQIRESAKNTEGKQVEINEQPLWAGLVAKTMPSAHLEGPVMCKPPADS